MDLISLIGLIAFVGLLVWAITALVPMPAEFVRAIKVVAIVVLALYVLSLFVSIPNVHVGR